MHIEFRAAQPDDAETAAPLVYSSGPAAFDYVFKVPGRSDAPQFLRHDFADGPGEFGFRNHVVGVVDDAVVAVGAARDGRASLAFMRAALVQILACYGLGALAVLTRGLLTERVSTLANAQAIVPNHRRMELDLAQG